MTHLSNLKIRLSNERNYLARSKSDGERKMRKVWINQIEREINSEMEFLKIKSAPFDPMTDEELLAELLTE